MLKPYERRVFYYETDKMGIVHHSNYIRIFEESRVDFLQKLGLTLKEIEGRGILMPVLSIDCKYKYPLRFDEPFIVYMEIDKFTGVSVQVSYKVVSRKTNKLCAEGTSSHCFADKNLKPIRTKSTHPDIYKIFHDYMKNK